MCRYLQRQPLLLILVLLIVLAPTSMVRAPALVSQRMRSSTPSFRSLRNSKSRSRKSLLLRIGCPVWIHISRRHLRISRPDLQRWNTISAPSLHVCARSRHMQPQHQMYPVRHDPWPSGEQVDGSTAAGSHGPGSSDDNRNTRRRLDTLSSPEDEQPRSAVLLRFPCEQYHKGITKWIDNLWEESNMPACNKLVRIYCKAGSASVRLAFETRANCQDFIARYKDDGIPYAITVPPAVPIQISLSANPNQLKTERSENNLRLCGENWLTILKFSSLMEMTKVHSSSQRSMLAHKSSASKIEETELENQFSNLLRLEADKLLPLLHLICVFLVFLLKFCNGFSLKLTGLMCDDRPLASPLFRRLAGRGTFFCGFPFRWVLHFVVFLIHHPALGKILLMIVGAHAILYLVFSFQLCGFDAANPY